MDHGFFHQGVVLFEGSRKCCTELRRTFGRVECLSTWIGFASDQGTGRVEATD